MLTYKPFSRIHQGQVKDYAITQWAEIQKNTKHFLGLTDGDTLHFKLRPQLRFPKQMKLPVQVRAWGIDIATNSLWAEVPSGARIGPIFGNNPRFHLYFPSQALSALMGNTELGELESLEFVINQEFMEIASQCTE